MLKWKYYRVESFLRHLYNASDRAFIIIGRKVGEKALALQNCKLAVAKYVADVKPVEICRGMSCSDFAQLIDQQKKDEEASAKREGEIKLSWSGKWSLSVSQEELLKAIHEGHG